LHHFHIFSLNFDLIQFGMNPFLLDSNRIDNPMLIILKYFVVSPPFFWTQICFNLIFSKIDHCQPTQFPLHQ